MSSPSPENISPAISPVTSQPPPQIIAPFPSPLPPSPPDPASAPPSLPPVISPASGDSLPPVISPPPPPVITIPPPPYSSPPARAPAAATDPVHAPELPVLLPPSPLVASPPSPSEAKTPLPPAPPSLPPPPPPPQLSLPPTTTPPPQAPENPNSPLPPIASSRSVPSITQSPPPATETIPSPFPNSSPITSPPIMDSPKPPDPSSSSSPPLPSSSFSPPRPSSPANGSLPAAVQIEKPPPKLNFSPGVIVGFAVVAFVVVAVLPLVVACVCRKRRRQRRSRHAGLPKAASLGPKDSFPAITLPQHSHLGQIPNPCLVSAPIKRNGATTTSSTTNPEPSIPSPPQSNLSGHGIFPYDQLVVATNGFSECNLIGEGGFGYVYKGVLPSGKEVAVKQLRMGSRQGEREFQAEVDIISRIHHKHLVSLVGYCITGAERLLVYEFVPNNTLEFHLHGKQQDAMEWATRLKIAIGSAKGLAYLHDDCNPKIIHRDIKASNILLDFRFEAKVSDFGLAKSFSDTNTHSSHISTRVVGTFGYLAPEYASSGKVTEKSDVYSYGVMLLELITGRPPIGSIEPTRNQSLVEWARPLLAQALEDGYFDTLVDPRLQRNYNAVQMSRMVACAAACVRHSAWLRPRMIQIVHALEGHASLTDLCEGLVPGSSILYSCPTSSYNAHQYKNDLNKFHITIADQESGNSMDSGSTSEYGLNPSVSSGDAQQIVKYAENMSEQMEQQSSNYLLQFCH